MPKRTRSQRIAEKSRRALEERLDERFLFHPEFEDYGIDGSIEEFDGDDRTTGLRFLVQLKATDGEDPGTALKRSIPTDHAAYYNSLSQPLLMVRYLAAADEPTSAGGTTRCLAGARREQTPPPAPSTGPMRISSRLRPPIV
jgi:uncharacterized protein DUF4365